MTEESDDNIIIEHKIPWHSQGCKLRMRTQHVVIYKNVTILVANIIYIMQLISSRSCSKNLMNVTNKKWPKKEEQLLKRYAA